VGRHGQAAEGLDGLGVLDAVDVGQRGLELGDRGHDPEELGVPHPGAVVAVGVGADEGQEAQVLAPGPAAVEPCSVARFEVAAEVVAVGEDVARECPVHIRRVESRNESQRHKGSIFSHLAGGPRGRCSTPQAPERLILAQVSPALPHRYNRTLSMTSGLDTAFLRSSDLFEHQPEEVLKAVLLQGQLLEYGPGHVVFNQGDEGDRLYIVKSGALEVVARPSDGADPVPVAYLGPGEVLGELALLTGSPRSASVRSPEHAELFTLDKPVFVDLMRT